MSIEGRGRHEGGPQKLCTLTGFFDSNKIAPQSVAELVAHHAEEIHITESIYYTADCDDIGRGLCDWKDLGEHCRIGSLHTPI